MNVTRKRILQSQPQTIQHTKEEMGSSIEAKQEPNKTLIGTNATSHFVKAQSQESEVFNFEKLGTLPSQDLKLQQELEAAMLQANMPQILGELGNTTGAIQKTVPSSSFPASVPRDVRQELSNYVTNDPAKQNQRLRTGKATEEQKQQLDKVLESLEQIVSSEELA